MPANRKSHRIYLLSAVLGAAAAGLSVPLFSFIIWLLQLPVSVSGTFSLMSLGAGCLIAGVSAGLLRKQGGIINGLKAALLLFSVLVIITFIMGNLSGEFILGRFITAVLCGAVGGILGVNRKSR